MMFINKIINNSRTYYQLPNVAADKHFNQPYWRGGFLIIKEALKIIKIILVELKLSTRFSPLLKADNLPFSDEHFDGGDIQNDSAADDDGKLFNIAILLSGIVKLV